MQGGLNIWIGQLKIAIKNQESCFNKLLKILCYLLFLGIHIIIIAIYWAINKYSP